MKIIRSSKEMTAWSNKVSVENIIALVPTMGCLHEGHLSLMRLASQKADKVVVSIFVNPTQFGPNEDFEKYPRIFDKDVLLAEKVGVDVVFAPEVDDIYPANYQSYISVKGLSEGLCGGSRPGHFTGVTTIVGKLFNIVKPGIAVFGAKDFQQLSIIRKMVDDLNWDIEVVAHHIVRESDGLAMSSRNVYLTQTERKSALSLSRCIKHIKNKVNSGEVDVNTLVDIASKKLLADQAIKIDYVEIVDDKTLLKQNEVNAASVILLAVKIGTTRLIDNSYLVEK